MANYVITCCSTVDLSSEHLKERNIQYIPFHYYLDQTAYDDDLYTSLSPSAFYQALVDGAEPKTAQVNVDEFVSYFTPILESGMDLIHLSLSSGLSGVFNSANVAAEDLREKFPERKIFVVDTQNVALASGILAELALQLADGGMSAKEIADQITAEADASGRREMFPRGRRYGRQGDHGGRAADPAVFRAP